MIGEEEAEISPQDLIKPEFKNFEVNVESGEDGSEKVAWRYFWTLVGSYRIVSLIGKYEGYVKNLTSNIQKHFLLSPFEAPIADSALGAMKPMFEQIVYTGLIAAIDMFFNRFPKHERAV